MARKQKSFIVPGPGHLEALNELLEKGWSVKQIAPATTGTYWFVVAEEPRTVLGAEGAE